MERSPEGSKDKQDHNHVKQNAWTHTYLQENHNHVTHAQNKGDFQKQAKAPLHSEKAKLDSASQYLPPIKPIWDHTYDKPEASKDSGGNIQTNNKAEDLFQSNQHGKPVHELAPNEILLLIPRLTKDTAELKQFCFDVIGSLADTKVTSTKQAVSIAKEQAYLKSHGEPLTISTDAAKQKALLNELNSRKLTIAFEDLNCGISDNYLPAYMTNPAKVWEEAQHNLPAMSQLLNHVGNELGDGKATPASLCKLLTRAIFAADELDHFDEKFDRITCNDVIKKTKEQLAQEELAQAEFEKKLAPHLYQSAVIERNLQLATVCEDLETDCCNFGFEIYGYYGTKERLEKYGQLVIQHQQEFFKIYSPEQLAKDCADPNLTPKQRQSITSLYNGINLAMPQLLQLKDTCESGQLFNKHERATRDYYKKWLDVCLPKMGVESKSDPLLNLWSCQGDNWMELFKFNN